MADEESNSPRSPWPPLIIVGLLFLPGGILAFGLWGMLRWGRQRPSVVGLVGAVIGLLSLLGVVGSLASISAGVQLLMESSDSNLLGGLVKELVPLWFFISLIIGSFAGWGFAVYQGRQMKKNPYLTQLAGSWRYNFKYRRTPREYFSRQRNIRALSNGLFIEEDKAPLGLDEKTDEVVFRYDSEARKHTFLTGASGSGKALHSATWIPTVDGFKRVGRVKVGDTLFDQLGRPTRVLGVYQPLTKDHYSITLSNGEVVRACGDHLWTVKEAGGSLEPQVVNTREIAKNPSNWYISPLRTPIMATQKSELNSELLGHWLAGGALSGGRLSNGAPPKSIAHSSFVDDLKSSGWLNSEGARGALRYDWLMSATPSREQALAGATSLAGSYTLSGQTKLTLPNEEVAEYLRALVFSLGIQAGPLEESQGAYSFRYLKPAKRGKDGQFISSIGDITRKGAPTRGLIKFVEVTPIEDNPEHYFCFEVDSSEHLFLFGRSFTPTHNTITMQNMIYSDIEVGKTVVIVDFKRSPKFAAKVAAWADDYGRDFYHFVNGDPEDYDIPRSSGQCFYDPLKSGTSTSKADMVLGMREYDTAAALYKGAMVQLLQVLFNMLKHADKKTASSIDWSHGGIYQLASAVAGNGLGELAAANSIQVPPGSSKYTYMLPGAGGITGAKEIFVNSPVAKEASEIIEEMKVKDSPLRKAKAELQGQMRTIIASEYGRWMKTGNNPEDREIDLFKLTSEGANVILFSLNSDSEPDFARYVGSMIFSDLTNISALRRNASSSNQVNIYVDEFQAVPPTAVTSLLEKSRESKMALTIAQQSFDQVVASAESAGEAYLNSILDTCSNFIAHAGATEKSAIRLAEILGKEFVTVYSRTNESDSSFLSTNWARNQSSRVAAREEERWKFSPQDFQSLSSPDPSNNNKSSAVWVTKTSADPRYSQKGGATARKVWMIPAASVLQEHYEGFVQEKPKRKPKVAPVEIEGLESVEQLALKDEREARVKQAQVLASYEPEEEPAVYENENEDEWNFEEIPEGEEEEPEEEEFYRNQLAQVPEEEPEPEPAASNFNIEDLFSGNAPEQAKPAEAKPPVAKAEQPQRANPKQGGLPQRPGGLPTRPGGGLPIQRPKTDGDELSLPDL